MPMSEATTPLMQQYQGIKSRYPHALLLFRLGDFYELFYEDAIIAARELQITLTSRNREKGQPIPMCGVPYHAADGYIARLIRAGFKIAICDQMEAPGPGKKIVRREVVRVITPGQPPTARAGCAREQFPGGGGQGMFLAMPIRHGVRGFVHRRISGHRIQRTWVHWKHCAMNCRFCGRAKRCLPGRSNCSKPRKTSLLDGAGGVESRLDEWIFQYDYAERILREQFGVAELTGFGLDGHPQSLSAAGAIIHYLRENAARGDDAHSGGGAPASRWRSAITNSTMRWCSIPSRCATSNSSIRFSRKRTAEVGPTTLIAALDVTVTGMGARLLRSWMMRPLIDARPSKPAWMRWRNWCSRRWCAAKFAKN